jgi:hypothetical protein
MAGVQKNQKGFEATSAGWGEASRLTIPGTFGAGRAATPHAFPQSSKNFFASVQCGLGNRAGESATIFKLAMIGIAENPTKGKRNAHAKPRKIPTRPGCNKKCAGQKLEHISPVDFHD